MALANDIYIIYYKSENHGKINCSFLLYIRTLNIDVRPGSSNCKVPSKHRLVARTDSIEHVDNVKGWLVTILAHCSKGAGAL